MLISTYSSGNSIVHTAKPMTKVLLLICSCTLLFVWENWISLALASLLIGGLYIIAKISHQNIVAAIKPALWVLLFIFAVQVYLVDWLFASFVVLRFITMIMAASLLTLTTKTSDLISGIEGFLGRFLSEKNSESISLALSLCFRFIPMVRKIFEEVKEAQKARGLDRSWRALVTPTIIRTLKSADEISEAIVARSIDISLNDHGSRSKNTEREA